jgi:Tol biopolymer transport system component
LATVWLSAGPAEAAFPGGNGKIVFSTLRDDPNPSGCGSSCNWELYTINPDGTGLTRLTNTAAAEFSPSWSADGNLIVFWRGYELYYMNADGTGVTQVTNTGRSVSLGPSWSPDGQKIAFGIDDHCEAQFSGIFTIDADGSDQTWLTCEAGGFDDRGYGDTAWSPDGQKIAYFANIAQYEIFTVNPDGTGADNLTDSPNYFDLNPNWAPDGTKIAFSSDRPGTVDDFYQKIFTMNPDGSGVTRLTSFNFSVDDPAWSPDKTKIVFETYNTIWTMNADGSGASSLTSGQDPDWQPIARNYPRPKGATPVVIALTTAFEQCDEPNSTHGEPLDAGSCNPPVYKSAYVEPGTFDVNGRAPRMLGSVRADTVVGNPATAADEADVTLKVDISDIRRKSDAEDYTGELLADLSLRVTDRFNGYGGGSATLVDFSLPFTVPCTATADVIGATCSVSTSADGVIPGLVREGKRAIWELGQVKVFDGGSDGNAATTADNTLFAVQGIFVP